MTYRCGHPDTGSYPRNFFIIAGKEHIYFPESGLCPACFDRKAEASYRNASTGIEEGCPYCGKVVCTCTNRDCLSLLPKPEMEPTRSGY